MKAVIGILLLLVGFSAVRAQGVGDIDRQLSLKLKGITDAMADTGDKRQELLDAANERMDNYFALVAKKVELMDAELPMAKKEGLGYSTSDDKKLRVYDWDTWMGGTMHFFTDMLVYRTANGMRIADMKDTAVEGDPGGYCMGIDEAHTKSGHTLYLVYMRVIASTKDRDDMVTAYEIVNVQLVKKNFFKTRTKMLNNIDYGYDQFAIDGDKELPVMRLSKDKKKFYVPIVNKDGVFEKGDLVYEFDGEVFVFKGKE